MKTLHLLPVLMALGNTYGLLLVVVLLGYGLVDIPRLLLRRARPDEELNRIYLLATKADELLYEAGTLILLNFCCNDNPAQCYTLKTLFTHSLGITRYRRRN